MKKREKTKQKTSKTKAKMLGALSGDPIIYITDFLTCDDSGVRV